MLLRVEGRWGVKSTTGSRDRPWADRTLLWLTAGAVAALLCLTVSRGTAWPTRLVLWAVAAVAVTLPVVAHRRYLARRRASRQLEARLEAGAARVRHLESSARARQQEIATVVHELRNPLSTVRGFLETLSTRHHELDDGTRRQILQISLRNALVLSHRVDTLLEFERLSAGSVSVAPVDTDLKPMLQQLIEDSTGLLRQHEVVLDAPDDLRAHVDREALSHILGNLISNAAKHSPEGAVIRVTAVDEGDEVAISVTDQGTGIAPDDLPHIFDPFFRANEQDVSGAGIGLTVVQRYVQLSGGTVSVTSTLGEGTSMTFTLPRATSAATERTR